MKIFILLFYLLLSFSVLAEDPGCIEGYCGSWSKCDDSNIPEKVCKKGVYIWEDGTRYEGEWDRSYLQLSIAGQGKMTFSDGDQYEGEWYKNTPFGKGILKEKGVFHEGYFSYEKPWSMVYEYSAFEDADKFLYEGLAVQKKGNKYAAIPLLEKAAAAGSGEAHFLLAYTLSVDTEHNYLEAAKKGYGEAFEHYLNITKYAEPKKAADAIEEVLSKYPNLYKDVYEYHEVVEVNNMCLEVSDFDLDEFISSNNISIAEHFGIWQIAEDAANTNKFGEPNSKLVLQLVCKGGHSGASKIYAIRSAYNIWKKNETPSFNVCNHITSGYGQSWCTKRYSLQQDEKREAILELFLSNYQDNEKIQNSIKQMILESTKFFKLKAYHEEMHGGTAAGAFITGSIDDQRDAFLSFIKHSNNIILKDNNDVEFNIPGMLWNEGKEDINLTLKSKDLSLDNLETKLNIINQELNGLFKDNSSIRSWGVTIEKHEFSGVQKQWIKYKDISSETLHSIYNEIPIDIWKAYFTFIRIKQLQSLNDYILEWIEMSSNN